jgi:hypothetical protein
MHRKSLSDLIHIVCLERDKGPAADEETVQKAYNQISEIMEIPVEEVEATFEKGLLDYDKIKRRNKVLWIIIIAAGVAVVIWRVCVLIH